jgi:two-component system response regulator FixJ
MIYVVDDDSDVLGSLRFLLETDGFDVRTFRSAAALLNRKIAGKVDCFVLDYKMPAMSGIDLAKRLRNRHVGTLHQPSPRRRSRHRHDRASGKAQQP